MHALRMRWVDLAFLHWPVNAAEIRKLVPSALQLDTFDDSAWIGVTPFRMTHVRPTLGPPIPTATDFPELNVRTYVSHGGRHGVWFFSLDAASRLAVFGARLVVNLPYFHARMDERRLGNDVHYDSIRAGSGTPAAEFRARYRPTGDVSRSAPGSFEYWSTERYCLFSTLVTGRLLRLDIEHAPWPLQPASADIERNTMAAASGIALPSQAPRVHFAAQLDVVANWPTDAR
jgi:uncharacterized protein YqjF (DUF2071 family)